MRPCNRLLPGDVITSSTAPRSAPWLYLVIGLVSVPPSWHDDNDHFLLLSNDQQLFTWRHSWLRQHYVCLT